jgi:V8-like Glu-specific endopeptidase
MQKAENSKRTLVAITVADGNHAGFGVYVGGRLILTCAHVLQDEKGSIPKSCGVAFVALGNKPLPATVVVAKPPVYQDHVWHDGDVALLELQDAPPEGATPAPLATPKTLPSEWAVFGYPEGNANLTEIDGQTKTAHPLPELRGQQDDEIAIEPGFSGSPVFDNEIDYAVGLVRSGITRWEKRKQLPVRQSYMLPVPVIVAQLPQLGPLISNEFVRLSTVPLREKHRDALASKIRSEWQKLGIAPSFDYRVCAADTIEQVREIHTRPVVATYPEDAASARCWRTGEFLQSLTREQQPFIANLLHLQAPGGSGKSVFVYDAALRALDCLIVPYCVDLKRSQYTIATAGGKPEYTLDDLFNGTLAGASKGFTDDLEAGRLCLLIVDGLNEVSNTDAAKWLVLLTRHAENYPNVRILVCDRIVDRSASLSNAQLLTLHPLSRAAIDAQVTAAGIAAITDDKLLHLLSTPFFLHLAFPSTASEHRLGEVLAGTRIEMFEKYLSVALELPQVASAGSVEAVLSLRTTRGTNANPRNDLSRTYKN